MLSSGLVAITCNYLESTSLAPPGEAIDRPNSIDPIATGANVVPEDQAFLLHVSGLPAVAIHSVHKCFHCPSPFQSMQYHPFSGLLEPLRWVPLSQGKPEHWQPRFLCSCVLRYVSTRYRPPHAQCSSGSISRARASRHAWHLQPLRVCSGSRAKVFLAPHLRHRHGYLGTICKVVGMLLVQRG